MFNPEDHPHRRYNPLIDEWVIISPHRMKRPWKGQVEKQEGNEVARDSINTLCPGATRSTGKVNELYTGTFVFQNDFPALLSNAPGPSNSKKSDLFKYEQAEGTCRVMCFHPYPDLSLPLMDVKDIEEVIKTWLKEYTELSKKYKWVQIFENKGNMMGCSNPHPHCQIWGCSFLPNEVYKEDKHQYEYYEKHGSSMLMDYIEHELNDKSRIVSENEHWIVVVPFWAVWPYELLLMPKSPTQRLIDLGSEQQASLASIMKRFLTQYDNLFDTSFPYSMGWHGAPTIDGFNDSPHWQLHAHYYPPLLRSATVKKHLVGFELLSENMRDLTPEKAADNLRNMPTIHYKDSKKV